MEGFEELKLILMLEDEELVKGLKMACSAMGDISKIGKDISKSLHTQAADTENTLQQFKKQVAELRVQQNIHKDNAEKQKEIYDQLLGQRDALIELHKTAKDSMLTAQLDDCGRMLIELDSIGGKIKDVDKASSKWAATLKEVGLDKIYDSALKLATVGGVINFWSKHLSEAVAQASEWRMQNYELYGSIYQISTAVRNAQANTRMLQKEATAAAKALADVGISGKNFQVLTEAVGTFASATGVSNETAAMFAKRMEVMGATSGQTQKSFNSLRMSMAQFGLTGRDVDTLMKMLSKDIGIYAEAWGGGAKGVQMATLHMGMVAGAAKAAGMEMSEIAEVFDTLANDALKYAVLLGGAVSLDKPSAQFMVMAGNAKQAVETLKDLPTFLKNKLAKEIYGVSFTMLTQMDKVNDKMEEWGKKKYGADWDRIAEGIRNGDEAMKDAAKDFENVQENLRMQEDASYALSSATDSLKNAFVELIQPLAIAIAHGLQWFTQQMKAHPVIKETIIWIVALGSAFVALAWALKFVASIKVAWQTLFGIKDAVKGATEAVTKGSGLTSGLKGIGTGIKNFVNEIAGINWDGLIQATVALAILGGALWVFHQAVVDMTLPQLGMIGASLIGFASAMWLMSKIVASAEGDIIKAALAVGILGLAMIPMAIAMRIVQGVNPVTIILFAIAVAYLGAVLVGLAIALSFFPPAVPIMLLVAAAIVILAYGMLIMAAAVWVFAQAMATLAGLNLIKLGGQLFVFGYMLAAAAPALLIGAYGLAMAAIPLTAGLLLLWLASKLDVSGLMEFTKLMKPLREGIDILVGAKYFQFVIAALAISRGLLAFAPALFFFALFSTSLEKIVGFLERVGKVAQGMAGGDAMLSFARNLAVMLASMAVGLNIYAFFVERAAVRISKSLLMVAGSMALLKLTGMDEMIRTAAIVSVKTDVEDRKRDVDRQDKQTETLNAIKDGITKLVASIDSKLSQTQVVEKLDEIKGVVSTWLPEIADGGSRGFGSSLNQWNSNQG